MKSDKRWTFSERVDDENPGLVVHALNLIVLRSRDLDRSRRFYEALGLRFQPMDYGHGASGMNGPVPPDAPLVLNAKTEGVPPPTTYLEINEWRSDEPIPRHQIGFFVESVDDAIAAVVKAGGELLTAAADWPYGRRAAVADPDGHRIELSEAPLGRLTGEYPK